MNTIRELFRIGEGPSSSHTMAPKLAAKTYLSRFPDAILYRVTLFASLAATGRGHGTDRAILNVLDPDRTEIVWKPDERLPFHPNGLRFESGSDHSGWQNTWTVYSRSGSFFSALRRFL